MDPKAKCRAVRASDLPGERVRRATACFGTTLGLLLACARVSHAQEAPGAAVPQAGSLGVGLLMLQMLGAWLAASFAWLVSRRFEPGAAVRRCWTVLALGFFSLSVAETTEVAYAVLLNEPDPFPSVADAFFLGGYALSIWAFLWFRRIYRAMGFDAPLGPLARLPPVLFALLGAATLFPMLHEAGPFIASALTAGYVLADIIVLFPAFALIDMTRSFRGGRIWTVWAFLLVGFALFCAGDLLFVYFQARGHGEVDLPADVIYAVGYWAMAFGTFSQYRLLKT